MSRPAVTPDSACSELLEDLAGADLAVQACYQCGRCSAGCPISPFFDLLPMEVVPLAAKKTPAERRVVAFHRSFLRSVRRWGRTYEVGMLASYKARSGDLFGDLKLGWSMFRRGKLRLWPRKIKGRKQVKDLFTSGGKGKKE